MTAQGIREETGKGKRKAHKKSRKGCQNCKLRRVKCDETRPKCTKCINYGVSCSYDLKAPDLQMSFAGAGTLMSPPQTPASTNQTLIRLNKTPSFHYSTISDDNVTLQLDSQSMERLYRFQMRTALSIGSPKAAEVFQATSLEIAFSHPYLMHVIQTLTAIHDRYISGLAYSRSTISEVYHLSRAAALFNQKLNGPVQPDDRDALWATAALLGHIAFSSIEASTPEEAWPLTAPDPSDLEWIGISEHKVVIWNIANPLRYDSIFRSVVEDFKGNGSVCCEVSKSVFEGVPSSFITLYGLDDADAVNNSYYDAVLVLAPLLAIECNRGTIVKFLHFVSPIKPGFKNLLRQKDPRALLLLAYWYAKVLHSVWWLDRRATIECQAICIYLERYHEDETAIMELLQFPKERCGLPGLGTREYVTFGQSLYL